MTLTTDLRLRMEHTSCSSYDQIDDRMGPSTSPYKYTGSASSSHRSANTRIQRSPQLQVSTLERSDLFLFIAMAWRKKNGGESSASPGASPCHDDEREKVPRGHVPMVTGCGQRVVVPVRLLRDPCITELLDMAAQQYGYGQPGVLRIPCDAGHFRRVVDGALHRAD